MLSGIGDYRGKSGKWTEEDRAGVEIQNTSVEESEPSPAKRARFSRSLSGQSQESQGEAGRLVIYYDLCTANQPQEYA